MLLPNIFSFFRIKDSQNLTHKKTLKIILLYQIKLIFKYKQTALKFITQVCPSGLNI